MNQYQMSAPPLSATNKIILVSAGVIFLLQSILKAIGAFSLVSYVGLSAAGFFGGHIYQLITYPFIEVNLMNYLFNSLVVWFIGSELETQWGMKVYVRFLLLVIIGVGVFHSVMNLTFFHGTQNYFSPLHGLSGINLALLVSYALLYPERQMSFMMIFPMKARAFCLILAGIEAYMAIFSSLGSSWAHLMAMAFSYLIIRFQTHPIIKKFLHFSWEAAASSRKSPKKSGKKHLYVIKDDDQDPPKYWQ